VFVELQHQVGLDDGLLEAAARRNHDLDGTIGR
jgi:hypothetical protein